MKWQKHYLYTLSIWATLSYLFAQDPFVIDSSLSNSLPQTLSNSIELADVNNDGYTDIIVSGYDSTRSGLYIDIRLGSSDGTLSQGYQTNFITYPCRWTSRCTICPCTSCFPNSTTSTVTAITISIFFTNI